MLYHFIFSERRQLLHRYKTKNNYLIRINGWSSHINFAQNDPLKTFIIYGFPFLLFFIIIPVSVTLETQTLESVISKYRCP
jgi:hypothetical protein